MKISSTVVVSAAMLSFVQVVDAHLLDVEEQNVIRTGEYNSYGQEILESESKPWKRADGDASWAEPHQIIFPVAGFSGHFFLARSR